jgi:hypothetical protein
MILTPNVHLAQIPPDFRYIFTNHPEGIVMSEIEEALRQIVEALKLLYEPWYVEAGEVYFGWEDDDILGLVQRWWFKPVDEPPVFYGKDLQDTLENIEEIKERLDRDRAW